MHRFIAGFTASGANLKKKTISNMLKTCKHTCTHHLCLEDLTVQRFLSNSTENAAKVEAF